MRQKGLYTASVVLALALALLPYAARPAEAATYTVTMTADRDQPLLCTPVNCSLREAITNANSNLGEDIISFNIDTSGCAGGVCTLTINASYGPLPALQDTDGGTTIDGTTQTTNQGDTNPDGPEIEIDCSNSSDHCLQINSAYNIIKGLVINRCPYDGVHISDTQAYHNKVLGCYIGTDATGELDLGNDGSGVVITEGADYNEIGALGDRNVISANQGDGVWISGAGTDDNSVIYNYVGTDKDGEANLGNTIGVSIRDNARDNIVAGNLISGNDQYGVYLFGNLTYYNVVEGNYIGTNASGTGSLDNGSGVYISGSAWGNRIGGTTAAERNLISGNSEHGIWITGSNTRSNDVWGNYIGTDASGTGSLANGGSGVYISGSAWGNRIGGTTAAERNFISGNSEHGIWITGSNTRSNEVWGNYIGTNAGGADLGNNLHGIYLDGGAYTNEIGPSNVIAFNGDDGVAVDGNTTIGNTITRNSIFSNDMGIDLTGGANGGIAAPVIVSNTLGSVNVVGTACAGCTVEVFENGDTDGEGETYVGDTTADASGAFTVTVSSLNDIYLTATATDAVSGTSEFSVVFTATLSNLSTSTKSVDRTTASPGDALTYIITLTNTGTAVPTANVTDTLPANVTWADQCSASAGAPLWDVVNNRLLWSGAVNVGIPVTITYQVTVNGGVPGGTLITNTATVDDRAGNVSETGPVTVTVTVVAGDVYLPIITKNYP